MRLTALLLFITSIAYGQDTVYHVHYLKSPVYRPGQLIPAKAVNQLVDVEIPPGKFYKVVEYIAPPVTIPAVLFSQSTGVTVAADYIGSTDTGDWASYTVSMAGRSKIKVEYSRQWTGQGQADVRAGAADGPIIATIVTPNTGSWTTYSTVETTVTPSEATTVYIIFKTEGTGNIKTFTFE